MLGIENTIKIIVISPDLLLTEHLQTILDSGKFIIETADPTQEGIVSTRKANPDLFVVDDFSAGTGILSTCHIIRQYSCMPILVLSSQRKAGLVEQILDAGADEFLIKPVPGSVLIAHLNTLARRAMAEKEAALSIVRGESERCNPVSLFTH